MVNVTRLHVVIVNFNSTTHLAACLPSLLASDGLDVLVWDNGSRAADAAALRRLIAGQDRVTLIESSTNLGFGAAANRAVASLQAADDDVIWILNPDTIAHPGAIRELLRTMARRNEHVVVSPLILHSRAAQPNTVWYAGGDTDTGRGRTTHHLIGKNADDIGSEEFKTRFMTGAAPMMRMNTWKVLGGFPEDLFLYWEDVALSLNAADRGVDLVVSPCARIQHVEGGSTGSSRGRSATFYYYSSRNRLLVCGQTFSQRLWILIGRGAIETARTLGIILLRERDQRFTKLRVAGLGSLHGLQDRRGPITFI